MCSTFFRASGRSPTGLCVENPEPILGKYAYTYERNEYPREMAKVKS